jgi:hypothetical protein
METRGIHLSRRAKFFVYFGLFFCCLNFFCMMGLSIQFGSIAFPGGVHDASGYYVIDHGIRYDFTAQQYWLSYCQALVTWIAFPTFLVIVLLLYATGDITNDEAP